jgi:hypothetical protein
LIFPGILSGWTCLRRGGNSCSMWGFCGGRARSFDKLRMTGF